MRCEFCNSVIKTVPDHGICPNCGGVLPEQTTRKGNRLRNLKFPEPPIGTYKDVAGYLEIGKDSVTFYRNQWPFAQITKRTIPFSELYAVSFTYGKTLKSGVLCVREWQDRHLPLTTGSDAVYDETSVYFRQDKNEIFHEVYVFLKCCVDIVRGADKERNSIGSISVLGKYKGFYGYMELGADSLTVYKKALWYAPTERVIPYHEIAEVAFREAKGERDGGLSVRQRNDNKFISAALQEALVDDTSIDFSKESNESIRKVYDFLLCCVRENIERWSEQLQ